MNWSDWGEEGRPDTQDSPCCREFYLRDGGPGGPVVRIRGTRVARGGRWSGSGYASQEIFRTRDGYVAYLHQIGTGATSSRWSSASGAEWADMAWDEEFGGMGQIIRAATLRDLSDWVDPEILDQAAHRSWPSAE